MAEGSREETTADDVGVGHNQPEVVWDRWVKKRTFVRALEGTYGRNAARSLRKTTCL